MTTMAAPASLLTSARLDHVWPTLTESQVARIATRGRRRRVGRGDILLDAGEPSARMFVVIEGTIEIIRATDSVEQLVVTFGPGMFSGEGAMLTGRPVFVR
ncbi:MAG TPA: cyclic nucleotide-binding domain-containing protein, partial [Gemmatimonadaceae bacterium]|nr:cyclic nucleotide-binding domain-containing protein [Gemmatimonadaceae bacterium]